MSQVIARTTPDILGERGDSTLTGLLSELNGAEPKPRTTSAQHRLIANNELSKGLPARKAATSDQKQEINRFTQQLKSPVNQKLLARERGKEAAAGILTYLQGCGGICKLDANCLNGIEFYFQAPHARTMEAMTAKLFRGGSSTPAAKAVPALVRGLQVGKSISYTDSNNALVDGVGNKKGMNALDKDHHGLIGAWTISDHASIVVSRPTANSYEVTVKSTSVAVDKHDWNTGDGDDERMTIVFDQDRAASGLNHA